MGARPAPSPRIPISDRSWAGPTPLRSPTSSRSTPPASPTCRRAPQFFDRLRSEGAVVDYLLRLRRHDGALIWIEVTAQRRRAAADTLRIDALIRDVSARKKLEDQSRDLYHQLLQAEKMAALGQTISGVAHELNNPLATILSWAERLAERPADDKARHGLEVILGEAERAARIVRNLLTFSHKRQSTRMMVDLNEILHDTLALREYEPSASGHRRHRVAGRRAAGGVCRRPSDQAGAPQSRHQRRAGDAGRVADAARCWCARGTSVERKSVVFEVTDDGPGIAEEQQARVFDPFFTTKEVGKGTGLGLSVAYAIVQEHGGRIWLSSKPGAGASFFVELPIVGRSAAAAETGAGADLARGVQGAAGAGGRR